MDNHGPKIDKNKNASEDSSSEVKQEHASNTNANSQVSRVDDGAVGDGHGAKLDPSSGEYANRGSHGNSDLGNGGNRGDVDLGNDGNCGDYHHGNGGNCGNDDLGNGGNRGKKWIIPVVAVGTGVAAVAAAPVVVAAAGFTSGGIVAGSIAASFMSFAASLSGGGVAAGSVVATLQAVGATGTLAAAGSTVTAAVGAGGAAIDWFAKKFGGRKPKNDGKPPNNGKPPVDGKLPVDGNSLGNGDLPDNRKPAADVNPNENNAGGEQNSQVKSGGLGMRNKTKVKNDLQNNSTDEEKTKIKCQGIMELNDEDEDDEDVERLKHGVKDISVCNTNHM